MMPFSIKMQKKLKFIQSYLIWIFSFFISGNDGDTNLRLMEYFCKNPWFKDNAKN